MSKGIKNLSIKLCLALFALCYFSVGADACDKGDVVTFESLLMALPNEAFELGAEGLGKIERASLIKQGESDTYTWKKTTDHERVIYNKFARDSVFTIRHYVAEQAGYLCIHTSYGANNSIECWNGAKKAALLPATSVRSFLKDPDHFSEQALKKEYPVLLAFAKENRISASINLWMRSPLEEKDIGNDKLSYVWDASDTGSFKLIKIKKGEHYEENK